MEEENLGTTIIDSNFDDPNEDYGFVVEDWDEDEEEEKMEIPNTVFDLKTPTDFFNKERSDFGLSIMSGIAQYGVKPIVDAVTYLGYGATNLALKGSFETPMAKEMEEDVTILPKSLVNYEPETTAGKMVKPIAGAAYGMAATTAALGAAGLTGKAGVITNATLKGITKSKEGLAVGKILAPLINGIAANGLTFWEDEGNLSNMLQPHIKNPTIKAIVDYMAIKEDDTLAERVMKQSLEGGFTAAVAAGIGKIFKGLKSGYKYIKGKKAINAQNADDLAKELYKPVVEEAASPEKIAESVAEGKMIEPRKETIGAAEQTTKIQPNVLTQPGTDDVAKEVVKEINQAKKELGIEPISIPRNPKKIDMQEAKNRVAMELIGDIDIDNPEDLKRLQTFVENSQNMVEKTAGQLKAQRDTFVGGWMKLKEAKKNAEMAGTVLSDAEKTEAFVDFMSKNARAAGIVQDGLNEGAKAMNLSSKDTIHKANKSILESLENNLDEIATPQLFDIMESARTEAELISKVNAFLGNASEAVTKKGFDAKKLVALEQAGLMTAPDTLIRNVYTSLENLTLGVADDVSESLVNLISGEAVRNGADAREFIDIYSKGAAYVNFLKDSAEWGLYQARRGVDAASKSLKSGKFVPSSLPKKLSPSTKYRQSLPSQLTTNLPTEVGLTFSNDSNLGKMANGYIKMSGVGISETTDSFFDAAFFRGAAAQRANSQARRLKNMYHLTDEQTTNIAKTMLDNITNLDTTRRAYDVAEINEAIMAGIEKAVSKKASNDAAIMTFRAGQGKLTKGLTEAINKIPGLKIVTPFVKTGSTIVFDRFVYDRTPYGLLYEGGKSILGMLSPNIKSQLTNPALRNKFLAKQAVGASLLTYGAVLYSQGKITGDYSSDPEIRKQQIASGWQPNSWVDKKEDGTVTFTSLNNFGVLSLLLKYPAKIAGYYNDAMRKTAEQEKIDEMETSFLSNCFGMSLALGSAIADESVLRNISSMFEKMRLGFRDENDKKNFFINAMTNPAKNIVPRIFRQIFANKNYEEVIQNNIESLSKTFEGLPVKRDAIGNPIDRADFVKGMVMGLSVKKITPEKRYLAVMAKNELTFPDVQSIEFPTKGHSVRLDEYTKNAVRKKIGELGADKLFADIVSDIPKELPIGERDFYQKQIDRTYNMLKKQALMELLLENNDIGENYEQRLDFDMNQKYNIDKPVSPIPSLADF